MNSLELRLNEKIIELCEIADLYDQLANKTKGHYKWRLHAVLAQIEALKELRDIKNSKWLECYNEDLEEAKHEGYL